MFLFAQNKLSLINEVKTSIEKEEYIALAINKYILQTATLPKKDNFDLNWDILLTTEYLGVHFNKTNVYGNKDLVVKFNKTSYEAMFYTLRKNSEENKETKNNSSPKFYKNSRFRKYTQALKEDKLENTDNASALVLYSALQKQIVNLLKNEQLVNLAHEECTRNSYFHELKNNELIYKYCNNEGKSIAIQQEIPILVENSIELGYVKASNGSFAYAKQGGFWYEYYFQGESNPSWIPTGAGPQIFNQYDNKRVLSYIPSAKDLFIRKEGGCMLANGDIFCWGKNTHKKVGLENYGQINTSLHADFVNIPVMLKVQILSSSRSKLKWYNNPYRVKFEKIAINDTNVCGISPIFTYFINGKSEKTGGDLYCNGLLSSSFYEDLSKTTTSILKRNKYFAYKSNEREKIFLKNVAMVNDTIAVLSDAGKIYTFGSNDLGALGQDISNGSVFRTTALKNSLHINQDKQVFVKLYALRDKKTFAALDQDGKFWLWGERDQGQVLIKPKQVSNLSFISSSIEVNNSEFILKSVHNIFYKTKNTTDIEVLDISTRAKSVAYYSNKNGENSLLYVNKHGELQGSDFFLSCQTKYDNQCTTKSSLDVFLMSLKKLNEDIKFSKVALYTSSEEGKPFICLTTGYASSSQLYCWGKVNRALPLISTSLYDTKKIPYMNDLFINTKALEKKAIFFDEYNLNNTLFIKYPTYIAGFDYEFSFN